MITPPPGARVWLAVGFTDMRNSFDGLAMLVQEKLRRDPFGGQIFVFRGRRGYLLKALWWDGQGQCLFAKRLEEGPFRVAICCGRERGADAGTSRVINEERVGSAVSTMACIRVL
jgi:hypothetical protein